MFRGVQHINLDAKGRMAVPSRQRELLSVLGEGRGKLMAGRGRGKVMASRGRGKMPKEDVKTTEGRGRGKGKK